MPKNLFIDASHPNQTRVVLKSENDIEDYEYEGKNNNLIKNNIYLGKVSRIEPSLQAAFIDFGRERHGFLSFNDIQSDYYQIPKSDLEIIKQEEEKAREELSKKVEAKEEVKQEQPKAESKSFTQEQLDNIVQARVMAERKKYERKMEAEEKQKVDLLKAKQLEEAKSKAEIEKLMKERIAEKDTEISKYKTEIKRSYR